MHIVFAQFYSHVVTPDYEQLAEILRQRGHGAWVGTPNKDGAIEWWDGQDLVASQAVLTNSSRLFGRIVHPLVTRLNDYRQMWRVRRFLHEVQPDIVQVNPATVHGVWLLPIGKPKSMRFVIDWRQIGEGNSSGTLGFAKRRWISFRRAVLSRLIYDQACFLHEAGAVRVLGRKWKKWAVVVPLGVDSRFLETTKSIESVDESPELVRFIYIGTLSRVRKLERLLDAAAMVKGWGGQFRIDLVGPNRAGEFYADQIAALELDSYVTLQPPVPYECVPSLVLDYDVALAIVPEEPADWQYHPTLKVLEYRALGIPIIATDVAPNRDVVTDGKNGYLVQNAPSDFASAMFSFVSDQVLLEEITESAQDMREGSSWEEIVDIYLEYVYGASPLALPKSPKTKDLRD